MTGRRAILACTSRNMFYVTSPFLRSSLPQDDALSTLDLVSGDNIEFLLIIAPIKESYLLARSAFKVAAEEFKVPLKVCVIWHERPADGIVGSSSENELLPWKNYVDVIEAKSRRPDSRSSWWDLCRMTDRGAILVRPDEHIAWRAKTEIKNDPVSVVRDVFRSILVPESSCT